MYLLCFGSSAKLKRLLLTYTWITCTCQQAIITGLSSYYKVLRLQKVTILF